MVTQTNPQAGAPQVTALGRNINGYRRWLELAGIEHFDHGFLARDDYLSLTASMDWV